VSIPAKSLVALDTQILIWGGLRRCVPGVSLQSQADADKERRARILFHELDDIKATIIIPAVAVAELLCPIDLQHHNNFLAEVTRRFECPSFDIRAASLAARLWQQNRSLSKDEQITRSILKADMQIIAIAKLRGVVHFFSDDAKCRKLASVAGMTSHSLPSHALNLFTESEIREKDADSASAANADAASG
jgi:hypothetical protein